MIFTGYDIVPANVEGHSQKFSGKPWNFEVKLHQNESHCQTKCRDSVTTVSHVSPARPRERGLACLKEREFLLKVHRYQMDFYNLCCVLRVHCPCHYASLVFEAFRGKVVVL